MRRRGNYQCGSFLFSLLLSVFHSTCRDGMPLRCQDKSLPLLFPVGNSLARRGISNTFLWAFFAPQPAKEKRWKQQSDFSPFRSGHNNTQRKVLLKGESPREKGFIKFYGLLAVANFLLWMMKSQKGIVLPMDGRGVRLANSLVPPLDPISRGCSQQESELALVGDSV